MPEGPDTRLVVCDDIYDYRGVLLPRGVKFRQLFVTGPPGSGKSTLVSRLRGWPLEGYLDLSRRWWLDPMLTFRPREVHLGVPFFEHREALTVFDPEWRIYYSKLEIDKSRIRVPPDRAGFTSRNIRKKFVFEFLIPPPDEAVVWRQKRAKSGLFPYENDLTLDIVRAQSKIYMEVAASLHDRGVPVHVRYGYDSPPMRFEDTVDLAAPSVTMVGQLPLSRTQKLVNFLSGTRSRALLPSRTVQPVIDTEKLNFRTGPFYLIVRDKKLLVIPEHPMDKYIRGYPRDWYIIEPERYFDGRGGIVQLKTDSSMNLGKRTRIRKSLGLPQLLATEPIRLENHRGALEVDRNNSTVKIAIQAVDDENELTRYNDMRQIALQHCRDIYGGAIAPLEPEDALETMRQANCILADEAYRPHNTRGHPGAVLKLPPDLTPVILGDLHGHVDNVLKALTMPQGLTAMENNQTCLVLLGDMVHSDEDRHLDDMTSSILMLDFVAKLKIHFPENFFMLRGNHESFSADVAKGNVRQGKLFEQQLLELRGKDYRDEVERFFSLLPYIVKSESFIASHAAPVRSAVSYDTLVDLARLGGFAYEVTNNRVARPGFSMGYTKGDIKKFRRSLGVEKTTPFLVGHIRPSNDSGVWENFTKIKNYNIVYSSGPRRFGMMIGGPDGLLTFEPGCEPLIELADHIPDTDSI